MSAKFFLAALLALWSFAAAATTVWDAAHKDSHINLSAWLGNANLVATEATCAGFCTVLSAPAVARHTGKYYFEALVSSTSSSLIIGVANTSQSTSNYVGSSAATGVGIKGEGSVYGSTGVGCPVGAGQFTTAGYYIDLDNNKMWQTCDGVTFFGNGASPNPATNTNGISISTVNDGVSVFPAASIYTATTGPNIILNVGNYGFFKFPIAAGFTGWDANGSAFGTNNPGPGIFDSGNCNAVATLSGGSLTVTGTGTGVCLFKGEPIDAKYSGKRYFEIHTTTLGASDGVGIASAKNYQVLSSYNPSPILGTDTGGWSIVFQFSSGIYFAKNVAVATASQCATANGSYQGVAVDIDNGKIWCTLDGTNWNAGSGANPATGTGGYSLPTGINALGLIAGVTVRSGSVMTMNVGATALHWTMPSGFSAWDSAAVSAGRLMMGWP